MHRILHTQQMQPWQNIIPGEKRKQYQQSVAFIGIIKLDRRVSESAVNQTFFSCEFYSLDIMGLP